MHGGLNSSWFIKHGWWSSKIWRMWSCGMEWPKENREILPITSTNFQQNHQQLQLKTPPELEKQVESLNFRIILGDFPRTSPTPSHVEFTNKKRQVLNLSDFWGDFSNSIDSIGRSCHCGLDGLHGIFVTGSDSTVEWCQGNYQQGEMCDGRWRVLGLEFLCAQRSNQFQIPGMLWNQWVFCFCCLRLQIMLWVGFRYNDLVC